MSVLSDLGERLRALIFRGREERELQEELRTHIEMQVEENLRAGMTAAEARRQARLTFGSMDSVREEVRDASGVRPLEDFVRDVRHSTRTLARRPGFTIVAVATLAIGIGASTAMFTLVNSVLLRPLAYADPDRLVWVAEVPPDGTEGNPTSPRTVTRWRQRATSFEAVSAFTDRALTARETANGEGAEVRTRLVLPDYFAVLGTPAQVGRALVPDDAGTRNVVLGHEIWRTRYASDPGVVGRTIFLNDVANIIVGVMPADFRSVAGQPDLWSTMTFNNPDWPGRYLSVIGRLRPGVRIDAAQAEMSTIAARMAEEHPDSHLKWRVAVIPLQEKVTGKARPALLILLGAVSLLLVITCANVASLFLGRATSRRKEMAVRRSLGASRGRLIMQAMSEAFVIATLAGAIGIALAYWGTAAIVRLLPPDLALPRLDEVAVDPRALMFAVGVSVLTGLLFGAAPALSGSAVDPGGALRDSTRGATGGRTRLRGALVIVEVALAVVLLAGAGLLVRTVQNLMSVDTGMRAEGALAMRLSLGGQRYADAGARREFVRALLPRLSAIPGTTAAGTVGWLPMTGARSANTYARDDRPKRAPGTELVADYRIVSGQYFAAMGMRLVRGRVFDSSDDENAPPRFIINEALAQRDFAGEDPLGKRITYEWFGPQSGEIVGIVGSVRETGLDKEPSPAVYRPHAQDPWAQMSVVVRTSGDPGLAGPPAIAAVRAVDPALATPQVRTLEQVVTDTLSRQRLMMFLLAGFATVSLLLVVIGLYGVISWSVAQRTRELGVRMALGAQRGDVLRMVVREGMVLALVGVVIGIAGALAMSRVVAGLLFGVAPTDAANLMLVAVLLVVTTLLASWIPAHRATQIDPVLVLGAEG